MVFFLRKPLDIPDLGMYLVLVEGGDRVNGLREVRMRRGMTQAELATAVGVAPHTISRYEDGNRSPNVGMLMALAQTLKCRVDDILDPPPPPETAPGEKRKLIPVKRDRRRL